MFNEGWWGLLWFTIKMWLFIFFYVWLRGSLPRVRYDQFMKLGWKLMIPASLAWVVAVALIRAAQVGYFGDSRWATVITVVVIAAFVIAGLLVWDRVPPRPGRPPWRTQAPRGDRPVRRRLPRAARCPGSSWWSPARRSPRPSR